MSSTRYPFRLDIINTVSFRLTASQEQALCQIQQQFRQISLFQQPFLYLSRQLTQELLLRNSSEELSD